jgi:selenocysteine lyase/cysteine desulfurase
MHDARALSDLAHAHGAYLYADIIQAAGAMPLDVRAMNLDFCACASYKWLMGDMGLGYLYVREELQDKVLRATQFGWKQYHDFQHHIFPNDPPAPEPATWTRVPGAAGQYEIGTVASVCSACQAASLEYIHKIGVENIRAHAKPLTDRLKKELPPLGYPLLTPAESAAHIAAFVVKDPASVAAKAKRANITVKFVEHQMRVSPSVYNDQKDIDRLLEALA